MTATHKDKTFFTAEDAEDAEETPSCFSSASSASSAVNRFFQCREQIYPADWGEGVAH